MSSHSEKSSTGPTASARRRRSSISLTTLAIIVLVGVGSSVHLSRAEETFFLDTHDPANETSGVTSSMTLIAGWSYQLTVEGTFSIWGASRWNDFIFGGVNNHIEHHLFPDIPTARLPKARRITRAFCRRHGTAYSETGYLAALAGALEYFRGLSPKQLVAEPLA